MAETITINGEPVRATLSSDGVLRWTDAAGRERRLVAEREVLGVAEEESWGRRIVVRALLEGGDASCLLSCGGGKGEEGVRVRRDYVLDMPSEEAKDAWARRLDHCLDSLGRPKHLFIFLNPYGGKKCAWSVFQNEVKHLLEAANVCYELQETQYQLHAQELAYNMDLTKYDGIICMSGDGILVEVLNGLLRRDDWQSAIKTPLGLIPAGSGNGMVKSLLDAVGETCSVSNAVLAIIRGHRRALDIATISQGKTLFFSALMTCWGLIADVDIESEKFRWMGSARFDIYLLFRLMKLRRYNGHVSFLPAPGYETHGKTAGSCNNGLIHNDDTPLKRSGYQGPPENPSSIEWRSIEGPFVSILLLNVPWINNNAYSAPEAKFSDGYYDMVLIKDCPRLALFQLLLAMGDGSYVKSPYVEYIKVKAFRLVPGHCVGEPDRGGIIDSDGEVLARGNMTYLCNENSDPMKYGLPIELRVEQGLATVFCPL